MVADVLEFMCHQLNLLFGDSSLRKPPTRSSLYGRSALTEIVLWFSKLPQRWWFVSLLMMVAKASPDLQQTVIVLGEYATTTPWQSLQISHHCFPVLHLPAYSSLQLSARMVATAVTTTIAATTSKRSKARCALAEAICCKTSTQTA